MDNQTIAGVMNRIYNDWWNRWKGRVISKDSPAWEIVADEAGQILEDYKHYPLVVHLIRDLLDELEERSRNGEKRAEEGAGKNLQPVWQRNSRVL